MGRLFVLDANCNICRLSIGRMSHGIGVFARLDIVTIHS